MAKSITMELNDHDRLAAYATRDKETKKLVAHIAKLQDKLEEAKAHQKTVKDLLEQAQMHLLQVLSNELQLNIDFTNGAQEPEDLRIEQKN